MKVTPLQHAHVTQDVDPMLFQCWASVADGGLTLKQHWINVYYNAFDDGCVNVYCMPIPRHIGPLGSQNRDIY